MLELLKQSRDVVRAPNSPPILLPTAQKEQPRLLLRSPPGGRELEETSHARQNAAYCLFLPFSLIPPPHSIPVAPHLLPSVEGPR